MNDVPSDFGILPKGVCIQHVHDCPGSLDSDPDQWTWPAEGCWYVSIWMHENGGVPMVELSPDIVKA